MSLNRVMLIGNLGAKPEIKYLTSGVAVCEMSVATNEKWTDKEGQKQERVEWHKIVVWNKLAENCAKYLDKGRQVFVEGKLTTRSWDDKDSGEKRYRTEIVAQNVVFIGSGGGGKRDNAPDHSESDAPPEREGANGSVGNDEIPF